ncbi:RNA polymerase sigma factor [Dactylosporangium sp. CS-047395]|uniref:RNA polymerase sigma factor n=1 Tax=Dactylosporangium sp. CS-047395 TaxID=3239936 RepID=UPI003D8BBA87
MSVSGQLADAHRRGWGLVLAAAVRVTRDIDLAEECVQEAYASALATWPVDGVPANPIGWLTTAAKRRAIDGIRREQVYRTKLALLAVPPPPEEPAPDLLGLIFTCCHPALSPEVRPALTLRLVCGVSTAELARAFLVAEPTMAARLTRAKKKITKARISYRMPDATDLPDRLRAVLEVVHLLYTTGHTATTGPALLRNDLADLALYLARTLSELMPDEPETQGLLALLLATDARRATRTDPGGRLIRLEDQDRSRWDWAAIAEADTLIVRALRAGRPDRAGRPGHPGRAGRPGRYTLQAAIAALHAQAPTFEQTDWPQLLRLYGELLTIWPSPVVALNRIVPMSRVHGPEHALRALEVLAHDERLAGYQYLPAIRADLLERLGRHPEAAAAYREALALTTNEPEREFLTRRLDTA